MTFLISRDIFVPPLSRAQARGRHQRDNVVCVLSENLFTNPDPESGAAQQWRRSSMTKDDAVPADILRQQKLAVGSFDELHLIDISRDVSPRR